MDSLRFKLQTGFWPFHENEQDIESMKLGNSRVTKIPAVFTSGLLVLLLGIVMPAWASSFGFQIGSHELSLGKASVEYVDGQPQPPRYEVTVNKGQSFTLVARGAVFSHPVRGSEGKTTAQPFKPEAANWLFDDEEMKLTSREHITEDPTITAVRLTAMETGKSRVRFVGIVGGYEQTYDVCIEVVDGAAASETELDAKE